MCAFDIIQWFVLYTRADTHALPEIDPADKGTPDVTHECGAISRHCYPQFNTRLRLRRVTAVNFRSRPIYCMHVTLRVRVLNSREQLNFRTFRHAISTIISEPFSSLSPYTSLSFYFLFYTFHLFCMRSLSSSMNILDLSRYWMRHDAILNANAHCERYKWIICE